MTRVHGDSKDDSAIFEKTKKVVEVWSIGIHSAPKLLEEWENGR